MDNCAPKTPTTFVTFSLLLISILVLYTFSSSSVERTFYSFSCLLIFWLFFLAGPAAPPLSSVESFSARREAAGPFEERFLLYTRHFGLFSRCASALISTSVECSVKKSQWRRKEEKKTLSADHRGTTIFPVRHLFFLGLPSADSFLYWSIQFGNTPYTPSWKLITSAFIHSSIHSNGQTRGYPCAGNHSGAATLPFN